MQSLLWGYQNMLTCCKSVTGALLQISVFFSALSKVMVGGLLLVVVQRIHVTPIKLAAAQ